MYISVVHTRYSGLLFGAYHTDNEDKRISKMAQDLRFVFLSIIAVLTFGFALFVNYLAGAGTDAVIPVFEYSIGQVSDKYATPVTPADFTFAIWGLIYTWQVALIAYVLSTICRSNENDDPLYQYPPVISKLFLIVYSLNLLCNAGWCYVFCNLQLVYALVVIVLMALTLYIALLDNCVRVYNYYAVLYKRYRSELIANYVLIENGISLYCTWVTIASLIGLSIVQIYVIGTDYATSGTICFTILAVVLVLLTILENTLWESYLRNVYMHWLVVIWALSGNIAEHWDPANPNAIFAVVLLSYAVLALSIKTGLRVSRSNPQSLMNDPLNKEVKYKPFH